jgi:lipoate-protein ligase A
MQGDRVHRESTVMLVIESRPEGCAAYNMALDEVLFGLSGRLDRNIWRLYVWDPPAVSIGRNQRVKAAVNSVILNKYGIDMVRRPTGGRAIWHNGDVCFTHCGRSGGEDNPMSAFKADYMATAEVLIRFCANMGITATISPGQASTVSSRSRLKSPCFMSSGRYEITAGSKKIAGIAQYRSGDRFLIQGSVRLSALDAKNAELFFAPGEEAKRAFGELTDSVSSIGRECGHDVEWPELAGAFADALGVGCEDIIDSTSPGSIIDRNEVAELEHDKYSKTSWNERF